MASYIKKTFTFRLPVYRLRWIKRHSMKIANGSICKIGCMMSGLLDMEEALIFSIGHIGFAETLTTAAYRRLLLEITRNSFSPSLHAITTLCLRLCTTELFATKQPYDKN